MSPIFYLLKVRDLGALGGLVFVPNTVMSSLKDLSKPTLPSDSRKDFMSEWMLGLAVPFFARGQADDR